MSKRTVVNDEYKGLVEAFQIPAELHEQDGKKFASFGSVLPIHCATPEQLAERAKTTHHYCDVFTDELLAPLGELAYVRLDESVAEKVFLNRSKRVLLVSSDGKLAQWRCAPTFESANSYVAGAPIVNKDGALVSVVTARRGNHYAVSAFEGDGGYFATTKHWEVIDKEDGKLYYADKSFSTREELASYLQELPPVEVNDAAPPKPVLLSGKSPRIALVAENGGIKKPDTVSSACLQYDDGIIDEDQYEPSGGAAEPTPPEPQPPSQRAQRAAARAARSLLCAAQREHAHE